METVITDFLKNSIAVKERMLADQDLLSAIDRAGEKIAETLKGNGTLYVCGNGGSACDAMHFAEELVARYKRERVGYKAMHFQDTGTITCWSNDYSYEDAFARQAETFCTENDVFVGITTSGNSVNIIKAVEAAKKKGSHTIALTGKSGGKIKDLADTTIIVPSEETDRIQESHITIIHAFCEIVEK